MDFVACFCVPVDTLGGGIDASKGWCDDHDSFRKWVFWEDPRSSAPSYRSMR